MVRKIVGILLLFIPLAAFARTYKLEGKVGDKYAIVIELEETQNGFYSGKYAYSSTLRKNGNAACSWLYIEPDRESPYYEWVVRDCNGKIVEIWRDINFRDHKYLTARMSNTQGKTYDISARAVGQSSVNEPLNSFFKQHIGEYASEFDMFEDGRVKSRLKNLLGLSDFRDLKEIYQVQTPLEYHNRMYWGSGFMAHLCCDPAAIWAYDTSANAFYIWIRKDGRDHWWSETGKVPLEFKELVSDNF